MLNVRKKRVSDILFVNQPRFPVSSSNLLTKMLRP